MPGILVCEARRTSENPRNLSLRIFSQRPPAFTQRSAERVRFQVGSLRHVTWHSPLARTAQSRAIPARPPHPGVDFMAGDDGVSRGVLLRRSAMGAPRSREKARAELGPTSCIRARFSFSRSGCRRCSATEGARGLALPGVGFRDALPGEEEVWEAAEVRAVSTERATAGSDFLRPEDATGGQWRSGDLASPSRTLTASPTLPESGRRRQPVSAQRLR